MISLFIAINIHLTRMTSITELYVDSYYNEYDDTDRYFDVIYDLYDQINDYVDQKNLCLLDRQTFSDLFTLCINHMDRDSVDQIIVNRHADQLIREFGKSKTNPDDVIQDQNIDQIDKYIKIGQYLN